MATVCGGSLSLIDAGVPLRAPVAGLSIGLISADPSVYLNFKNGANSSTDRSYQLLTDIIGSEDHYGDMDFKIAGTTLGVTALQLDVKPMTGVPLQILTEALYQAHEARCKIIDKIIETVSRSTRALAEGISSPIGITLPLKTTAPRAEVVRFDPDRKRHLIGPGIRFFRQTCNGNTDVSHSYSRRRSVTLLADQL
jgi:polyribonucleotide nucleotidyltransferase